MRQVRAFTNDFEAHFAAGLLQERGIPCEVRGKALGDEPPFLPELWVLRDNDLQTALEALRERRSNCGFGWQCSKCRTMNEAAFDACWSCGVARP